MSRRSLDFEKIKYSNQKSALEEVNQERDDISESYVEFIGMTKVRRGTTIFDENDLSEKIINDIVAMDAAFDPSQLPDLSQGHKSMTRSQSKIRSERYGNFHTIDWLRDLAKDRFRHKWIIKEAERGFLFEKIQALFDSVSGWFCVLLVGLGAGIVAGVVDIGSGWTVNLKSGVCKDAFWLNREQCCWDSSTIKYDEYKEVECDKWKDWTNLLGLEDAEPGLLYIFKLLVHVGFSLFFAALAALLVKFFAPYACGSGVPEIKTILSGFVIRGYLGKWTLIIKSIGMILASSAGLTLGKEGPFVHVASCCGNIFSYLFPKYGRNEAKKREILSAAASAGVAVAFGAPIGGVLFSLEEVSYYFPLKTLWRSFFCAMFAAFVVRTVNPYGKGHEVLFFIEYKAEWYLFELIPFIILGMLGGLFGLYFIRANIYWCKIRKTTILGKFPITEVLAVTLLTSLLGYFNEYTRMPMSELIRKLVGKCGPADDSLMCDYVKNITNAKDNVIPLDAGAGVYESIWKLVLALIFYLVMLVITFGIKVPCGLFVPSLTIGAITGRLIGVGLEIFSFKYPDFFIFSDACRSGECIVPGKYALVGACAFLGGATRMTVSLVVIMVELTSSMPLIVPLMVSAFTAKIFGELLFKGGIYDAHIELNGYPFLDNKEDYQYASLAVDVMKPQKKDPPLTILLQEGMTIKDIESVLDSTTITGFPIVVSAESQYLLGYILKRDLKMAFDQYKKNGLVADHTLVKFGRPVHSGRSDGGINLFKLVDLAPICVTDQTPMDVVINLFRKMGVSLVLVTHYGKLLGVITKKDILKHLASEEERERLEKVK